MMTSACERWPGGPQAFPANVTLVRPNWGQTEAKVRWLCRPDKMDKKEPERNHWFEQNFLGTLCPRRTGISVRWRRWKEKRGNRSDAFSCGVVPVSHHKVWWAPGWGWCSRSAWPEPLKNNGCKTSVFCKVFCYSYWSRSIWGNSVKREICQNANDIIKQQAMRNAKFQKW